MKKLFSSLKSVLFMAVVGIMAVSCTDNGTGTVNPDMVGEWQINTLVAHYKLTDGSVYDKDMLGDDMYSLGFEEDGTGAVYRDTETEAHVAGETYTWSYAQDRLTVVFASSRVEKFSVTELTKDKLVMSQDKEYDVASVKVVYSFDRIK